MSESQIVDKNKSWADLMYDFLNSPPTSSVFRVYILSFILWNKGIILYIFFGRADIADKLVYSNWSKYTALPDFIKNNTYLFLEKINIYVSIYLIPVFISAIIYSIVFKKFNSFDEKSLYDFLYAKHKDAEIARNKKEVEVIKSENAILSEEVKKKTAEINRSQLEKIIKETDPTIQWIRDYQKFKVLNFSYKFDKIIESYYEKNAKVKEKNNFSGEVQFEIPKDILAYCHSNGIIEIDQKEDKISVTNKGKYFIKKFLEDPVYGLQKLNTININDYE